MSRRRPLPALGLSLLLIVAALLAATAPVTAQSSGDEPLFDGVLSNADENATTGQKVAKTMSDVSGSIARLQDTLAERFGFGDETAEQNATTYANDFDQAVESNNKTIREYSNNRVSPGTEHEVFAVYFHDKEGNNVTRYVVTSVSDGNWTDGPRVLTPSEFNETNRSKDQWVSLDWYASKHSADETREFVEEFATEDKDVSRTKRAALVSKYGTGIKSSMWGDDSPSFEE